MEQRYAEIETGNNHLMEEITKLTREFTLSKEREESWKEEVDRLRLKINNLEEDNRALHQQLLGAQNVNHLTQVSLMATQTNYEELQIELERVTKEMQVGLLLFLSSTSCPITTFCTCVSLKIEGYYFGKGNFIIRVAAAK